MKQIAVVLDAIDRGGRTSQEVSDITGLSVAICSAHISQLIADGLVRLVRVGKIKYTHPHSHPSNEFERA